MFIGEASGNGTSLTYTWICSHCGWVTVEQLAAHIRTDRVLWDYKGHQWECGSKVQWLASDPVHSIICKSHQGWYTSAFQSCVNVWSQDWDMNSNILCILYKSLGVYVLLPSNLRELEGKRGKKGEKAEKLKKKQTARCINLHCLATSPRECVFVTDHAGDGLHVHFGSLYNPPPQGWQLWHNTLHLKKITWWKASISTWEMKKRTTKLEVMLMVKGSFVVLKVNEA